MPRSLNARPREGTESQTQLSKELRARVKRNSLTRALTAHPGGDAR